MSDRSATLQPGTPLGELEIIEVLGSGTFSISYLARDPALDTLQVIKEYFPGGHASRLEDGTVHPDGGASEQAFTVGLNRFLAEGRLAASLDHPGIIKVLRYFEANGTAFLVMPYYQGQSLAQKLQNEDEFGQAAARKLILSLLGTLQYLHAMKVLHLDIKPANIFITEDGNPMLFDFGAAASFQPGEPVAANGLGSRGYAAPEQSDADGKLGPWTDFYALAATLYRCISGQVPAPAEQRAAAIRNDEPDPLQPVSGLINAAQFGGLIDLIDHGMEVETEARPASAQAWRKSFESLDWRRRVAGRTDSAYEAEGREWLPMILLAAFLLAMAAVVVYLLTDHSPESGSAKKTSIAESSMPETESPAKDDIESGMPPPAVPAAETIRWQTALQADTVLGYRQFIEDFPASVYLEQALVQLEILDDRAWQSLSAENTREAFTDYLEVFPEGKHAAEALVRIDEIDRAIAREERERVETERRDEAAWQLASETRTVASMDQYIGSWPAGLHVDEATRLRRQLNDQVNDLKAFELAGQLGTRDAYQAYIDAFPGGTRVTQALQMMDTLNLRPGKVFKDCPECPQMIVVPAGSYQQGSVEGSPLALGNEKPIRTVTIQQPFAVGLHEVTMAQWDACVEDQGCSIRPADNGWGRATRPVIMVSWNDVQQFLQWLNKTTGKEYRLPSESEWEYFARAGEESDWLAGDAARLCEYANVAGTETGFRWQHESCTDEHALGTLPAGSMRPNDFGLYDVIGNVSEWTADCMNLSYLDAPVDGSAWGRGICSSHITRGGSWVTGSREVRLPARFNLENGDRNDFTGFRVIRTVEK